MVEIMRMDGRTVLRFNHVYGVLLALLCCLVAMPGRAADYSKIIAAVKPGVVAIASHQPLRQPQVRFIGTGFVVADGRHVITNAHNIPEALDIAQKETLVIVIPGKGGSDDEKEVRLATLVSQDKAHDIALLKFSDAPLPVLPLGDAGSVKEGQEYLVTGFPIGSVLGYHAVTHHAMISAITPAVQPVDNVKQLNPRMIKRMLTEFRVFQLDAIAYPGNSGSPVYHPETGEVVGVLNSVFVKDTKESVLERPSGISYAIPVTHVLELLREAGMAPGQR